MIKNIIISLCVGALIILSAVLVRNRQAKAPDESLPIVTSTQLAEADGKDGEKCWVAVDGTVYEIEQGFKWVDGQHTESQGQAYCGADLSTTIDKAPHGRTKLFELKKVGTLN